MSTKKKLLVIEVHSDDSAISVSGFLDKYRDTYEYHFALIVSSDLKLHHCGLLSREQRLKEYEEYVSHFEGIWHRDGDLPFDADALLDTIPKKKIVANIEAVIAKVEPKVLICQGPSFHHDHTIVYESVIAATRPTARHYPDEIYIAENPTYVHSLGVVTDFVPNLYVSLSHEQMKKKLDCFKKCFPSQVRQDENYLSEEGIRSWARYRGIEARCTYAEALRTYFRLI